MTGPARDRDTPRHDRSERTRSQPVAPDESWADQHGQAPDHTLDGHRPLVDWETAGRRILRTTGVTTAVALIVWFGWCVVDGRLAWTVLGNLMGLVLLIVFATELWVVGGSALRGMLRAGERGERLSGDDVGLLPPQLRRGGSFTPGPVRDDSPDDDPA